jgi:hypothetical protein
MPYLVRRSIAFGNYISPRQAPRRRRTVSFAGHYGLGQVPYTDQEIIQQCTSSPTYQNLYRMNPALAVKWLQQCAAQIKSSNPTHPAPVSSAPTAAPAVSHGSPQTNPNYALENELDQLEASGNLQAALQLTQANPQVPGWPAEAARLQALLQQQQQAAAAPVGPAPIVAPATPALPPTSSGTIPSPAQTVAGTPVPVGFPITQIFVDPVGHQWMYQQSTGQWIDATQAAQQAAITSEQQQAAQIAAATATSPGGPESPTLVTSPTVSPYLPQQPSLSPVNVSVSSPSGYSDILNWLTESTLVSPIPNWVLLAGAGLVALKLSGKKGLL